MLHFDAMSGHKPPIIDLSLPDEVIVPQIASACSSWGFFQVINHNVPSALVQRFKDQSQLFFDLPRPVKESLRRDGGNARGYFDDELTKQRRDWKEAIDIGVPGSRDWSLADEDPDNACLDGYNRFPQEGVLPHYRSTVVQYFEACATLSDRIAVLMAKGLGVNVKEDHQGTPSLVTKLREDHTSYLRTNFYPPFIAGETPSNPNEPPPLGISPHKDAGFLTVLVQDDDCHSLQVANFENGDESKDPEWVTVHPMPGAFTINTGDMAQIWSNGRYRAPLHRVLTSTNTRISAPFFYNPGFRAVVEPLPSLIDTEEGLYNPCSWGYFRAVRFAGDFTDIGIEIQISDFLQQDEKRACREDATKEPSAHLRRQKAFLESIDFSSPFDIERYRPLLES